MEERKRKRSRSQLEDIPDLYHDIQSRLPYEEAARTSVLSKSWLHAWSTIPILRFPQTPVTLIDIDEEERKRLEEAFDRTLIRYLRDNIPIQNIDLSIDMTNHDSDSLAEKWIKPVAIRSCLKQLSVHVIGVTSDCSLTLPAEILSGQNLTDIKISCSTSIESQMINPLSMTTSNPVINCVYLRRLQLNYVHISEEVLDDIFSICRLLVNVVLSYCTGFTTVNLQNLHRLYQFEIKTACKQNPVVLKINNVPNIRLFTFKGNTLPYDLDSSLGTVTILWLGGMIMDDAFLHTIKSKFPFLESLTLDMKLSTLKSFDITCASMKRLSLMSCPHMLNNVKVYAPKLVTFYFSGNTMPSLFFPAIVLEQIKIELSRINHPMNDSFFLKMREAFTLSRKCDIRIDDIVPSLINLDLDDLRRKVPFPAMNVQRLSFTTILECSQFFDALFLICHPKHVVVNHYTNINNHFCKVMVREVLEKKNRNGYWGDYLKDVEIRRHGDERWETLTNSWRSFLDGSKVDWYGFEFKLNWHSVE